MKYKKLQRTISGLLAVVMIMTYPSAVLFAYAAGNSIKFKDGTTSTTIIEGKAITAQATLDANSGIDDSNPFSVKIGGLDAPQGLISIAGSNPSYTISANPGSASGTLGSGISSVAQTIYSLEPTLITKTYSGDGTLSVPGAAPTDPPTSYYMTVKSELQLPITADSSFSFTTTSDETVDGAISYSKVVSGTGYFKNFIGAEVTRQGAIVTTGGKKVIRIVVAAAEKSYPFEIAVESETIKKNSKFTINYRRQGGVEPMFLTVISPQKAVNDTAKSIEDTPLDPQIPENAAMPYIKLENGETLDAISTNFTVLKKVSRYNSKDNPLQIKWEWKANDPQYQEVVTFPISNGAIGSVKLDAKENDVTGLLRAKVSYAVNNTTTVESVWIEKKITILGIGNNPKLRPKKAFVGQNSPVNIIKVPTYMDVYQGNIAGVNAPYPYAFTASLDFGTGRGRAEKIVIRAEGSTPDAVDIYLDGLSVPYSFKSDIVDNKKEGSKNVRFVATKSGQTHLYFDYYVKDATGKLVVSKTASEDFTINVSNSTPSSFAQLEQLLINSEQLKNVVGYQNGRVDYGFKSEQYIYEKIQLPNMASTIDITPIVPNGQQMKTKVHYKIEGGGDTGTVLTEGDVDSNRAIGPIPMNVGNPRKITLTVTAQDGTTKLYMLTMTRMSADINSKMKSLIISDANSKELLKAVPPKAAPYEYEITVPYGTRWAKIVPVMENPWATIKEYAIMPEANIDIDSSGDKNWIRLKHPKDASSGNQFYGASAITTQTMLGVAQDASQAGGAYIHSTTYTVKIRREDPNKNALAKSLDMKNQKEQELIFDKKQKFDKNLKSYTATIPYSTSQITFDILPEEIVASGIIMTMPNGTTLEKAYEIKNTPITFTVPTPLSIDDKNRGFDLSFAVRAEDTTVMTAPQYKIRFVRALPDQDSSLTALDVTDQFDKAVTTFSFNPQTTIYNFTVPFDTEQIKVTPKARSPLAVVTINKQEITVRDPSYSTLIKTGSNPPITVTINSEDVTDADRIYVLNITREEPSNDARLKNLEIAGGESFKPDFLPNTTAYKVKLTAGTKGLTFTPTPVASGATVTINGNATEIGKPSSLYEPTEVKSVVSIVVTAQDGKTKMTYTVEVTNLNMIPKSSDADLSSLVIREGSMSPPFKAGVTDYEVAVKDEVASVDILPTTRSEEATIVVKAGNKVLGDYYDRYSTAVYDGDNEITVEVTAEDGKTKKLYTINLYRKDEGKQGTYKPVTVDMVDFTKSPIVVDISKYTTISAEVFNTLKEKYPNETMIFEGNDYSLQLTGKDMKMLVPHATIYDLGITFNSPEDEEIYKLIYSEPKNDGIDPVLIHFNHHGALPGKMLFSISLGRAYRTQNSTWNYYNDERERIDYYGGVRTNSRGTFTVPIMHMSTYIYCVDRIAGAENKSGSLGDVGDITGGGSGAAGSIGSSGKPNPNTGVGGRKE